MNYGNASKLKVLFGNASDNNAQSGNTLERQTHPIIHRVNETNSGNMSERY